MYGMTKKQLNIIFIPTDDLAMFEEILDSPPEPNEKLKQAHERYKQKLVELKTNKS